MKLKSYWILLTVSLDASHPGILVHLQKVNHALVIIFKLENNNGTLCSLIVFFLDVKYFDFIKIIALPHSARFHPLAEWVRGSDCHCQSHQDLGFDPGLPSYSGI
jgi:hypothetical protein